MLPPNLKHRAINTKFEVEPKVPSVVNPSKIACYIATRHYPNQKGLYHRNYLGWYSSLYY